MAIGLHEFAVSAALTTPHGDCNSALGAPKFCCVASLDAKTLAMQEQVELEDVQHARILGALDRHRWLCAVYPKGWAVLDRRDFAGLKTAEIGRAHV